MRALWMTGLLLAAPLAWANHFSLHSSSVVNGQFTKAQFASSWGCSGQDESPQVSWSGAPVGTKSYALTIYDLDAPTGSGWWHWVVVNIPVRASGLPQGASGHPQKLPLGALETNTDGGVEHYNGICPPLGQVHRYQITIHALKADKLALPANATGAMAGFMINMNRLGTASLMVKAGHQ